MLLNLDHTRFRTILLTFFTIKVSTMFTQSLANYQMYVLIQRNVRITCVIMVLLHYHLSVFTKQNIPVIYSNAENSFTFNGLNGNDVY